MSEHPREAAQPRPPNRLARESSPYLLQHAHNPVDWYPWGAEAFEEARRRDVPMFLSIGYSTCYWCHVMERESFESDEIAALMNPNFVCIKVDREERPDVDDIYMAATVMMTGHGGWPMSVFLEPKQLRPFFCGTYFPPAARPGMGIATFPQVLGAMSGAWRDQRDALEKQAAAVADAVREQLSGKADAAELGQQQVEGAVMALLKIFDRTNGGFGGAPKFPQPVFLDLLLDVRDRAGDDSTADAIDIAIRKTLDKMACGGIHDHAGGGFHRYSVDAHWLVPHFEKMLYDNAQLLSVYARAARRYGDTFYKSVVHRIGFYIGSEMTHERGGFFSAQDAEVDGREGLNYLWTAAEIKAARPPDEAEIAVRAYGLDQGPNFRDPHHPDEPMGNVLRLAERPERLAPHFQLSPDDFADKLSHINSHLYDERRQRKQPRLDDKILASWNGLMIGALATAAMELEDPTFLDDANAAADFVLSNMIDREGRLLRVWRNGVAKTPALLEDHAFVMHGLLAIARASTGDAHQRRVMQAIEILAMARVAFFDESSGRIFDTRAGEADLFVRTSATHDGALPSGVSVMIHSLIDLAELTHDEAHLQSAVKALAAISGSIAENPVGAINSTRALFRLLAAGGPPEALRPPDARPRDKAAPPPADFTPVEIYASTDRVTITGETPAETRLVVKIAPGYHVVAADPGAGSLTPFRVGIFGGTGVAAYAEYPEGEWYGAPSAGRIRVYTGTFELRIALEASGKWGGRPLLKVEYQACSDTECLRPMAVELDIAIDQG